MSAVENVDARIARLQQSLDAKCTELRALQTHQRYNPDLGVDEDIATGRSVAVLEVRVAAARNMLFSSGFLAGKTTYVRAWLEPRDASARANAPQCTRKTAIQSAPRWQEALCFQSIPHVGAVLMVEVVQEERIGRDVPVGALQLPLLLLQNQRVLEKWHVLSKDSQATASELLLSCRFSRSRISALELDVELLQNQLRELHNFVERQQQHAPAQSFRASDHYVPRNPLHGKEVTLPSSMQRSSSSRFRAVATFPQQPHARPPASVPVPVSAVAARKREHFEFARMSSTDEGAVAAASVDVQHRAKRQRVAVSAPAPPPVSLPDKLANWLLPSQPAPAAMTAPFGSSAAAVAAASSYPFKQAPAPEKRRVKKPVSSRPRLQKTPSVLQSFEQWLFREPENTAPN